MRHPCCSSAPHYAQRGMRNALRRLELMQTPMWFGGPLMVLGGMYLIAMPLGVAGRWVYCVYALIVAAASGLFLCWRYKASVVERSEDWVLVRCGRRKSVSRHTRATSEAPTES